MAKALARTGSDQFKLTLEQITQNFDPTNLATIAIAALHHDDAENLVRALHKANPPDLRQRSTDDLIMEALKAFTQKESAAHRFIKAIDSISKMERSLVSSLKPETALRQLEHIPALRLTRQGARLIWAIVRDDREEIRDLCPALLQKYKINLNRQEELKNQAQEKNAEELLKNIENYYSSTIDSTVSLQNQALSTEIERANLMIEIGLREKSLSQALTKVQNLQTKLEHSNTKISTLEEALNEREQQATTNQNKQLESNNQKANSENIEKPDENLLQEKILQLEKQCSQLSLQNSNKQKYLIALVNQIKIEIQQLLQLSKTSKSTQATANNLRTKPSVENKILSTSIEAISSDESGSTVHQSHSGKKPIKQNDLITNISSNQHTLDPLKNSEDIAVFVDVANIAGAARLLFNSNVDYKKLLQRAVAQSNCITARAYAIDKAQGFKEFAFALERSGYKVLSKQPKKFQDGTVKADMDIDIAVDMLLHGHKIHTCVLASGDADFIPAVKALQSLGVKVIVMAFSKRASGELMSNADQFIELSKNILLNTIDFLE